MSEARRPAAFRIDPARPAEDEPQAPPTRRAPARAPRALKTEAAVVMPAEIDVFDEMTNIDDMPPPVEQPRSRWSWSGLFLGALGVLVSLAIGLWTDKLIRSLFQRSDWLG